MNPGQSKENKPLKQRRKQLISSFAVIANG